MPPSTCARSSALTNVKCPSADFRTATLARPPLHNMQQKHAGAPRRGVPPQTRHSPLARCSYTRIDRRHSPTHSVRDPPARNATPSRASQMSIDDRLRAGRRCGAAAAVSLSPLRVHSEWKADGGRGRGFPPHPLLSRAPPQIFLSIKSKTALTTSEPRLTTATSIDEAYGTGASSIHSRLTGASSRSKHCSWMSAETVAPTPPELVDSSRMATCGTGPRRLRGEGSESGRARARDSRLVRARERVADRLHVERLERAQLDQVDVEPLGLQQGRDGSGPAARGGGCRASPAPGSRAGPTGTP